MRAGDLVIEIGGIVIEGMPPEKAGRVQAMIEKAVAEAARKLAGKAEGAAPGLRLGDLRFEIGEALDPAAEADIARRLEAAVTAAWEAAR
jgi:hypothetical protein